MNATPEAPPILDPGAMLLPSYRVVGHLRRGSSLDVYDVWSEERRCRCIAKVVRPDRLADPAVRRRLIREGRLLLRLSHPHIVRAYELRPRPVPVLILETLSGATLEYLLEQSPRGLGAGDVAVLGMHLISAVHYLHRHGVLHLDLKPSNLVSERSVTKVLDLDIARAAGRSRGSGTRQYMAPEQVRGGWVSPATDVWGIGVVLFEAITKRLPFDFDHGPDHPQRQGRAHSLRSRQRIPPTLRHAVMAALAPDPAERPTLEQLASVFTALLTEMGLPPE